MWEYLITGADGMLYQLLFVVPAIIFSLIMSANVKSTFRKYSQVRNSRGITGAQAAKMILDANGLSHVRIEMCAGELSDHFDPRTNVVRLSESVYHSTSVASVGVAAHEVGHACQHNLGYAPIKIRNTILPIANIGSAFAIPLVLIGFLFEFSGLVTLGIVFFSAAVVFQLVTLPVEINASKRAMASLSQYGVLSEEEAKGTKKVLTAAAMTYVASLAVSLMQLLRLILLARNRND